MRYCFLSFFLWTHAAASFAAESSGLAALLASGRESYSAGRYSKALQDYRQAWELGKAAKSPDLHAPASEAGLGLAGIYAHFGMEEELEKTLRELKGRRFWGPASSDYQNLCSTFAEMKTVPGNAYKCGAAALDAILAGNKRGHVAPKLLRDAVAPAKGFSLHQLSKLANQLGMGLQAAHRKVGAEFVVPSVVHWKLGHYGALLEKEEDRYLVKESVSGRAFWMNSHDIEDESSGYFLVGKGNLPKGWSRALKADAENVYGRGEVLPEPGARPAGCNSTNTGVSVCEIGRGDDTGCDTQGSGMPSYGIDQTNVALLLKDTPLQYQPGRGPAIKFNFLYHSKSSGLDTAASGLSPNWSLNWNSYVEYSFGSNGGPYQLLDLAVVERGGGRETYYFPGMIGRYSRAKLHETAGEDISLGSQCPPPPSYCFCPKTHIHIYRSFVRELPSGWTEVFEHVGNYENAMSICPGIKRKIYLTQLIDPQGNQLNFDYDAQHRMTGITDANGQRSDFTYSPVSGRLSRITDPFGRYTELSYDSTGNLASIRDALGLVSTFQYEDPTLADFVTSMTTPYGTSKFNFATYLDCGNNAWRCLVTLDPAGNREKSEFNVTTAGADTANVPSGLGAGVYYFRGSSPDRRGFLGREN